VQLGSEVISLRDTPRKADQMSIAQNFDELARPYKLPADAPYLLDAHGFIRLRAVLSKDLVRHYEPEITRKVIELNTMHLPLEERNTYSKAFLQVENLWRSSAAVQELVFARRLAQIAAELMGVDGVRLYADQALYKEPGGGITPWHADQYYWPLDADRAITAWIPLQDTPIELGPLEFADGSHRFSYGRDLPIGDESERELQAALGAQGFRTDSSSYQVGDISYHLGWVFHHAGPNRSHTPRRVMTIIYVDADIRVAEPVNDAQRRDLAVIMPGAVIGEPPDTPLNPELYRRSAQS
jgi:ectoine hydroxylase-related dioxygenase (phytanoyl-CoA dioxygenase family)